MSQVINIGLARLAVRLDGEQSTVADQYSQVPLQLHRPLYLDGATHPTVYIKTPSSGLLGGDSHTIEVLVEANSRLELRTQSATLVYPGESTLTINLKVGDGGKLVFLPHCLILGAHAGLIQEVRIELGQGASIEYSDTWCAGRIAMGEVWKFDYFDYKLQIFQEDKLTYRERFRVTPENSSVSHSAICGDFTHFASLFSFGPMHPARSLKDALPATNYESSQNWTLTRDGGTIYRRCSKVNTDHLPSNGKNQITYKNEKNKKNA